MVDVLLNAEKVPPDQTSEVATSATAAVTSLRGMRWCGEGMR
jgi:hypothetical protein